MFYPRIDCDVLLYSYTITSIKKTFTKGGLMIDQIDMRFDGKAYDPEFDRERLSKQIGRVYECMLSGQWRTLQEISMITGAPESSVSAQLRNLRKPRFGGMIINKRRRGEQSNGLWEYQLISGE